MPSKFALPKDKTQREEVVSKIYHEGKSNRSIEQIRWWLSVLYMQGYREFTNINYQNGTVSVSYMDESGILKFRYEEILAKYQAQLGRLLALDISPQVRRKGVSLDGMRKASIAQVVLNDSLPEDKINEYKMDLMPALLHYGTVGAGLWYESDDEQGLELIPPWQLFPIPVNVAGPHEVKGLLRVRPVPVSWIESLSILDRKGKRAVKDAESQKIAAQRLPIDLETLGDGLSPVSAAGGGGFFLRSDMMTAGNTRMGKGGKKDETLTDITMLVEMWLETSDGYLAEYGIYAGMDKLKELHMKDHTQEKYPLPVRVIRDITVASFWGRSTVDMLMPLNNEQEMALSSLFQAVADFDLYGFLMWPGTMGVPAEAERGQDGIKKLVFEPDYSCPDLKPFQIQPTKLVKPQIDAATIASGLMDKMAQIPSKLMSGEAPGRVDSASALGYLGEMSTIPLSPTAKSIAVGMAGVFRSLLRLLKDRWSDQKVVGITNLDDSLAGIVLDTESGGMHLGKNAIPYPDEVSVTVASEIPVSREQQKAELKEALKDGRINIDEFNRKVRILGLDIPVGDEIGWQNYRRAMLENILLFGDGQTPGTVTVSPNDLHRVHEEVLLAFMARPEFYLANNAVIQKFEEHLKEHQAGRGQMPEQLPYMEDTAAATLGMPVPGMMPPQGGMPLQ